MAKALKVVTIGGGTGAPIVIQSLNLAGVKDISAISASMDSGGKTGHLRSDERDQVIAVSDLLRNLLSLINPRDNHKEAVSTFSDTISYTDGRNRNLGYILYYALLEKYSNDFIAVQKHLERLLGIRFNGIAIPVTLDPAHISFSTASGQIYQGEHELDRLVMSTNTITKVWLDSPAVATREAVDAILQATHIVYCPGSIYGSVLANFLPRGITSALKKSPARKILISNLVSDRNQTHNFTPLDFYRLFSRYTGLTRPFDTLVCPKLDRAGFEKNFPLVNSQYAAEHSHFLGWDQNELSLLSNFNVDIITSRIWSITPSLNRIRHDPSRLSHILKKILHNDNK